MLPSQYADFATMRGDASDGLPGVPGVGEKTASALLLKYGDLRGIIAAAENPDSDMAPSPRKKILAAEDYLKVAPKVVEVARDIKLGRFDATLPAKPAHPQNLELLAEHYNLGSAVPRLIASWRLTSATGGDAGPRVASTGSPVRLSPRRRCTPPRPASAPVRRPARPHVPARRPRRRPPGRPCR